MSIENHQSAYHYRSRPRPVPNDDDGHAAEKTKLGKTREAEFAQSNARAAANKLVADSFFGTVAGRLAQEIHDEFLVCKICLESYNNPKCLSCLHTFCAACIDKHISAEVTYNKYTDYRDFTCPLCRKRTQLPLGGVKRLPDNFLISGLTELVMRQRASSHSSSSITLTAGPNGRGLGDGLDANSSSLNCEDDNDRVHQLPRLNRRGITFGECEICAQVGWLDRGHSTEPVSRPLSNGDTGRASSAHLSNAPQASSKCLDCNKLLCAECVKRHRNTKVTKDHATFDLQSGKEIECKEHPGETVRFYCEACSSCICVLCTFNEHREHEVTSFGEAVNCLRAELEGALEHASRRILSCQTRMNAVNEASELVHNLERQIHETAEHFIEAIQKQEQEILHDLHEFIGSKNMATINHQLDAEHRLELAENIYKESSKYVDGQEIDMLLAKSELYEKLNQLNELRLDEAEFEPITAEVYFRPGTAQLGYLTNEVSGPPTEQYEYLHLPLSSSQSSLELANRPFLSTTASQTDSSLLEALVSKPKPKEEKQYRCRGCNTEPLETRDGETNTRPRGINTSISFSEAVSNANSEELLNQLGTNNLDFQSMDNLTRARMRRKLREHCHTFDVSTGAQPEVVVNGERQKPPRGLNDNGFRRYSTIDKQHH
ncbi:E3 ubiquitin-protein ligase trim56 [Clonorchis sinensis]|uniref:E3 ubiquitin-protein ligase trim56 n=2 Tax=Clonorchis sinensis TaxID=79923 RepID=A0A8T1MNR4_CLOSI|nr:E3 ubiquitin-protein ligase trim56 [Clonorchis sinensis]